MFLLEYVVLSFAINKDNISNDFVLICDFILYGFSNVSVKSRNNSSFLLYKWYQRAGIVKLAILICQTSFEDLPQNENIKVFDLAYISDF